MHILIIANSEIGLWSFRKELLERLIKDGHRVSLSLPSGERTEDFKALGCEFYATDVDRRGMNPVADLKLHLNYRRLLKCLKPDVVLGYTIKPNVYGGYACAKAGIPFIPNITGLGTAVENGGPLQHLTVGLYKVSLKKASCIFFQNKANEAFFIDHSITPARRRLIPGSGVNTERFSYCPYPNDGKIRFLFISRLMRQKGIEDYFAAAEHFKGKYDNLEFHIVGRSEDNYDERLKNLCDSSVIVYHGLQKDVRPFIADSSCLIHPTFYPEGMSNVILEASSSGRPVIATRRPGCMEAVDDGQTGYLFPEQDREGLFAAIEKFLSLSHEQREAMGKAARKKMVDNFDRNIVVEAYLDEIRKATSK